MVEKKCEHDWVFTDLNYCSKCKQLDEEQPDENDAVLEKLVKENIGKAKAEWKAKVLDIIFDECAGHPCSQKVFVRKQIEAL